MMEIYCYIEWRYDIGMKTYWLFIVIVMEYMELIYNNLYENNRASIEWKYDIWNGII